MDRSMKFFFIFCFAVFFFTGCQKADDKSRVKNSKDNSQSLAAKSAAKNNTIDLTTLSPEQRKVTEDVAKDVAALLPLFNDADVLFRQVWEKIWSDKMSRPDNVFRLVSKSLSSKYAKSGLPLLTAAKECELHDYSLRSESPGQYRLIYTNCMNRKNPSVEELATIEKSVANGKTFWKVEFVASNIRRYLGNSLSLLGVPAKCKSIQANPSSGRLQSLECSDIGQNWNAEMYLQITQLKFDRTAAKPLVMSATVFAGLQKPKYTFEARDVPFDNQFLIQGQEAPREEEAPASALAATPQVPSENSGTTAAGVATVPGSAPVAPLASAEAATATPSPGKSSLPAQPSPDQPAQYDQSGASVPPLVRNQAPITNPARVGYQAPVGNPPPIPRAAARGHSPLPGQATSGEVDPSQEDGGAENTDPNAAPQEAPVPSQAVT
jgi:hypothetical protein